MKNAPMMTSFHKKKRLDWALNQIIYATVDWRSKIFNDEKKFNLDGRHANAHY